MVKFEALELAASILCIHWQGGGTICCSLQNCCNVHIHLCIRMAMHFMWFIALRIVGSQLPRLCQARRLSSRSLCRLNA